MINSTNISVLTRIYLRDVLHSNLLVLARFQLLNMRLHTWFLHRATAPMQCSREEEVGSIKSKLQMKCLTEILQEPFSFS